MATVKAANCECHGIQTHAQYLSPGSCVSHASLRTSMKVTAHRLAQQISLSNWGFLCTIQTAAATADAATKPLTDRW